MVTAIFAGSFDPFTNGHLDLVQRSFRLCDELIIGIGNNPAKKTLFSLEERISFIRDQIPSDVLGHTCFVRPFDGLLADLVIEQKALILIRGVRSLADFEYEMTMAQVNKKLLPNVETILLPADSDLSIVSSSLIKELARYKSHIVNKYCSQKVVDALFSKFSPIG